MRYLGFFVPLIILFVGCENNQFSNPFQRSEPLFAPVRDSVSTTPEATTVEIELRTFQAPIELEAVLEPKHSFPMYSLEGGIVKAVYKQLGDYVVEGEVVAELENPRLAYELEVAKARLQEMREREAGADALLASRKAQEKYFKTLYDRMTRNYGDNSESLTADKLSKAELEWEQARSLREQVIAENELLQEGVEAMDSVVQTLQARVDQLVLKAPFSGFLAQYRIQRGDLVRPAFSDTSCLPLAKLVDATQLVVRVQVPADALSCIQKGIPVALEGEDFLERAVVSRIGLSIDPGTQTFPAEVDIENPEKTLRPGHRVQVRTESGCSRQQLAVPLEAVQDRSSAPYLWVLQEGTATAVPVVLGLEADGFVGVSGEGLDVGTEVVLNPGE
jgi:RND family efflux transporter MFP subunit